MRLDSKGFSKKRFRYAQPVGEWRLNKGEK